MDSILQFHKSKTIIIIITIALAIVMLLSQSVSTFKVEIAEGEGITELTLPLKKFTGKYLYANIPTPVTADVYVLTITEDEKYKHYSFVFENFTLQEAKDYIVALENNIIKAKDIYEINYDNDYPIFNYLGWIDDRNSITLSQCNTSGGITINIKNISNN